MNSVNTRTFPAKQPLSFCSVDATETFQNVLLRNGSGREQDVFDFCAVWTGLKLLYFDKYLCVASSYHDFIIAIFYYYALLFCREGSGNKYH